MTGKALALALLLLAFRLPAEEPPAPAAPVAPPGVPLTLADVTARALARNNDIALERESFRIADASVLRADGSYDPTFRLDARYRNHTDPANSLLSGAPAGEISPSAEGMSGTAAIGALLPTGGAVSLSASGARDLTNNLFVLLSPAILDLPRDRRAAAAPAEPLDRPGPPRDPHRGPRPGPRDGLAPPHGRGHRRERRARLLEPRRRAPRRPRARVERPPRRRAARRHEVADRRRDAARVRRRPAARRDRAPPRRPLRVAGAACAAPSSP